MQTATAQSCAIVTLPVAVTIDTGETFLEEFRRLEMPVGTSLILDASETQLITIPGLQLILAVGKTVEHGGGTLVIVPRRDALQRSYDVLTGAEQSSPWEQAQ